MAVDKSTIDELLNDYGHFTKEEFELINTFQMKNLAKYNNKKYELIANSNPSLVQSALVFKRFGDMALQHKQLILNTTMQHIEVHKEILLQLLSILQSLVNNPNIVDVLINFLNSEWYGQQDFKQFITSLISDEMTKLNNLYSQQLILTTQPLICFLPELYNSQNPSIDTQSITEYYETINNNWILEP